MISEKHQDWKSMQKIFPLKGLFCFIAIVCRHEPLLIHMQAENIHFTASINLHTATTCIIHELVPNCTSVATLCCTNVFDVCMGFTSHPKVCALFFFPFG